MSNRIQAALQAVKRRKRGVASVVSVAAIGALALGTLGVGTAVAHGAPPFNSVGAWQLKGAGPYDEEGLSSVRSYHVSEGAVKSFQIRNGSVHEEDLSNGVQKKVNHDHRPPQGYAAAGDGRTSIGPEPTTVATLDIAPGAAVVTAKATLQNLESESNEQDLDHGACRLVDSGDALDSASVALGQDAGTGETAFAPVTLTALVTNDSDSAKTVELSCFGGGETDEDTDDRSVADVSLTGVRVSEPAQSIN